MTNVLFILVDCLRADICYHKHGRTKTPHVDEFVAEGAAFDGFFSIASTTTPCVTSIMTGNYPNRHGVRSLTGYKVSSKLLLLPEVLRDNGYHTAAYVTGPLIRQTGLDRGFDIYDYRDEKKENLHGNWKDRMFENIRGLKGPWFAYVHLWELHKPRRVLPEFDSKRFGRYEYERAWSSLDFRLGEIFEEFGKEDTLIILTGDHGENYKTPSWSMFKNHHGHKFGLKKDPRYLNKHHGYGVFEFLVNVPFVIKGRGIKSGVRYDTLASQVDIMPTVLDLCGVGADRIPNKISGRSLAPVLRGEELPATHVFMDACDIGRISSKDNWLKAIRTDEWKYIYAPKNPNIEPMLYNLKKDPFEKNNLARKLPQIAEKFQSEIIRFDRETSLEEPALGGGEEMTEEEAAEMEAKLRDLGYM